MSDAAHRMTVLRLRTGLNQRDFAKKFGLKEATIKYWESGLVTPTFYQEFVIERILDLVDLYGGMEYHWINNCRSFFVGL